MLYYICLINIQYNFQTTFFIHDYIKIQNNNNNQKCVDLTGLILDNSDTTTTTTTSKI